MIVARAFLVVLVVTGVFLAGGPSSVARDREQGQAAERFVHELCVQALSIAGDSGLNQETRRRQYGEILDRNFDVPWISRFVLGRYWRGLSDELRDQYQSLFRDIIITAYSQRFRSHSGFQVKVLGHRFGKRNHLFVESEIFNQDGSSPVIPVVWRLVPMEGGFRVIDLVVTGVSMGITQRNEYASVIRNNGGQVEGLIAAMRKQLEGLHQEG